MKLLPLDDFIDELLAEFDPKALSGSSKAGVRPNGAMENAGQRNAGVTYAGQQLKEYREKLASMVDGEGRNTLLNKYAFCMGRMVAREWIAIEVVKDELKKATLHWPGYTSEEVESLLNRVIRKGMLEPHPNVGEGGAPYLIIDHITKENTTPNPRYLVVVEGKKVVVSMKDLYDFNKFCMAAMEVVNHAFRFERRDLWLNKLDDAMTNRFDEIDVPVDVTEQGDFQELLNEFLTGRQRASTREGIFLGRPWEDEPAGVHYFRLRDLQKFLKGEKYEDCSRKHLMDLLRQARGKAQQLTISNKSIRVWGVPESSLEGPSHPLDPLAIDGGSHF